MPYHTNEKKKTKVKPMKDKKKKKTMKRFKTKSISERQKKALQRHSEHHTDKHINEMISLMKDGDTFGEAHTKALQNVGS